uniref:Uncharacterized protein n=1 Tax=Panthera leo TaxID=9689 RepID=A0A8C8WFK4_PANLE
MLLFFFIKNQALAKLWKEPKCPSTDEWIKKLWFIYTMEYYMAMRKNEIWPFVATMKSDVMLGIITKTAISLCKLNQAGRKNRGSQTIRDS